MGYAQQRELENDYVMHTFGRKPVELVEGRGMELIDDEGRVYLDFLAGIGVCSLGHCHPALVETLQKQADRLIHVGNYYYIEGRGDAAGRHVGVDVVEAPVAAERHRGDDGNVVAGHEVVEQRAVDVRAAPHPPELGVGLLGHDDARVGARHAHGEVAVLVERGHELAVDLARKHAAHDLHGLGRGDALAVLELDGQLRGFHGLRDGLAATVHDDGIHADDLQQHDVAHDVGAQLLVDHGRAAVLDDDGLASDVLDPRQRLDEHLGRLVGDAAQAGFFPVLHVR